MGPSSRAHEVIAEKTSQGHIPQGRVEALGLESLATLQWGLGGGDSSMEDEHRRGSLPEGKAGDHSSLL